MTYADVATRHEAGRLANWDEKSLAKDNGAFVVLGHVAVLLVYDELVDRVPDHALAQVVRYDDRHGAAVERERVHVVFARLNLDTSLSAF